MQTLFVEWCRLERTDRRHRYEARITITTSSLIAATIARPDKRTIIELRRVTVHYLPLLDRAPLGLPMDNIQENGIRLVEWVAYRDRADALSPMI